MTTNTNGLNDCANCPSTTRRGEHRWPDTHVARRAVLPGILLVLGGCASVPADLGRGQVDDLVRQRGQEVQEQQTLESARERVAAITAEPLSPDNAIRIALLNNPQLQGVYASLAFGAADVYAASRVRNPVFSAAILDSNVAGERNLQTFGLVASITDLITLPARRRLSRSAMAALQQEVGSQVLRIAAETEKAYYAYVGAQQVLALRTQTSRAGGLSAELAKRFHDAGNLTRRELALERSAASQLRLTALEAKGEAFVARTNLASMMGLSVGESWRAPAQLKLLLEVEDDLDALLTLARDARLDLAAARARAGELADRLGFVGWSRWLGELDAGIERERETDGARLRGPTVDWEIPIFSQHSDARLRANAEFQTAMSEVRHLTIATDNDVRLAYAGVRNARARVAEYRDTLIPQRIETVARAQEEVNFMLIGIFELLVLKQDEYDAYQGYLEALSHYWIARAQLRMATGGVLPSTARIGDRDIDVNELVKPAPSSMDHGSMKMGEGMDHSGHDSMKMEGGMDHSGHDSMKMEGGMDHSGHDSMKMEGGMDHSGHDSMKMKEGMDHSGHDAMEMNKATAPVEQEPTQSNDVEDHSGHQMQEPKHLQQPEQRQNNQGGEM